LLWLPILIASTVIICQLSPLTLPDSKLCNVTQDILGPSVPETVSIPEINLRNVAEASVGRAFALKRFHARARGRGARVEKAWSNLTIVVREREETA